MRAGIELAERGLLPDAAIRAGIRSRLRRTLAELRSGSPEQQHERRRKLLALLRGSPIAVASEAANLQHYELPAEFFDLVLGKWKKYSCCFWPEGVTSLDQAEEAMLELTARRAGIEDGMRVLDLGCGWGSLALWSAKRFPGARIVALSNSRTQGDDIERRAKELRLANVTVITADAADFGAREEFDRVVSVEMLEHTRNTEALFSRIARWLAPGGKLFVHVFTHREHAYLFDAGAGAWMSTEFFTGGMMPSDALYLNYQRDLHIEDHWIVGGLHYARTLRAWLDRLDAGREAVRSVLARAYGLKDAGRRMQRWRLFFMACEESFAFSAGREWRVGHYLFAPRS